MAHSEFNMRVRFRKDFQHRWKNLSQQEYAKLKSQMKNPYEDLRVEHFASKEQAIDALLNDM